MGEHDMHEVLLKCFDTGCDYRKCMGDTIEGEDQVNAYLHAKPADTCNKLKYVQLVQKCRQGELACSEAVRSAGSEFQKLNAAFCGHPAIAGPNGTVAAAAGPGACAEFSMCVAHALQESGCLNEAEPLAQGWYDFNKTSTAICNYDPHKKQGPCRDLCQDEYRHAHMLPENATVTNKCDYYRDFVFGQHRPGPCRTAGYSDRPTSPGSYEKAPGYVAGGSYDGARGSHDLR